MIHVGSLFSGIGGFELGIEAAFGDSVKTVWQVEKDPFCQKVLKKHWPNTLLIDDVKKVNKNTVPPVDMLIGGFPCQSISIAGNREGLQNEEKSGLWWEMFRIIGDLEPRPRIIVLENVSNVLSVGGSTVVGSLAQIGYCSEWTIIRASDFGAPHKRARWFCISWDPNAIENKRRSSSNSNQKRIRTPYTIQSRRPAINAHVIEGLSSNPNNPDMEKHPWNAERLASTQRSKCGNSEKVRLHKRNDWTKFPVESPFCRRNDGISNRLDRIRALGNAIVPACSEYVGRCILNSGLVDDLLEDDK